MKRRIPAPAFYVRYARLLQKTGIVILLLTILPVATLRWLPPATSAFMLEAKVLAWWQGRHEFKLRHRWVDREEISPYAALAVVASEDQLFKRHFGFDFKAITKALNHNRTDRRVRGASTITQQTAKNLFLYSGRNFLRKGLEAYFTVLIELLWPKRRTLEVYLNVAQFGDGIYGVEAASEAFFSKSASQLSAQQAALLAATLPNPLKLRADKPSAYLIKRRNWILGQMQRLGGVQYVASLWK